MADTLTLRQAAPVLWAKVVDHARCIGCHACSTACKSENGVPIGVHRTYLKYVDVGRFPQARRAFQVTRCNQCAEPPWASSCPTAAMHQRPDGIVDFDKRVCAPAREEGRALRLRGRRHVAHLVDGRGRPPEPGLSGAA